MAQPGDTVRVEGVVKYNGVRTDPVTLTLAVTTPAGSTTTYTYPAPTIVKQDVGYYYANISVSVAGTWTYVWTATYAGSVTVTVPGAFLVDAASETVVFTVYSTNPVSTLSGMRLQVFGPDGIAPIASGMTNNIGQATFLLKPGSYRIEGTKPMAAMLRAAFTVLTTDHSGVQSFSASVAVFSITAPSAPSLCRIFGYVTNSLGQAASKVQVLVSTVGGGWNRPFIQGGATGIDPINQAVVGELTTRMSDANGYWETDAPIGALLRVRIPAINYDKIFAVPDIPLLDIRDARTDSLSMDTGVVVDTAFTNGYAGNPQ